MKVLHKLHEEDVYIGRCLNYQDKSSGLRTNAVYIKKQPDRHTIVTDFGNMTSLSDKELEEWRVCEWQSDFLHSLGEVGLDPEEYIESPKDRFETQIELLQQAIKALDE